MSTIRFARLHFQPRLPHYSDNTSEQERLREALLEVIDFETDVNQLLAGTKSDNLISRGEWGFGGVVSNESFIAGRIGKERDHKGRAKDPEQRDYVPIELQFADVAFFVIDLEYMVIAYEYNRSPGKKAPYRIIRDVFNSYHEGREEISFSPLIDKEEFGKELEQFALFTEIEFENLHPTNPGSSERSKPMDNFLRQSGIDSLYFNGRSSDDDEDDGIKLHQTALLNGGIGLAEEGYGSATVRGEDDEGKTKEITTEETPVVRDISILEEDENDVRNRKKLLEAIRDVIDEQKDGYENG